MFVDATIATMKLLKLHSMAQSIAELSEQASPAYSKAEPILQQWLKAEVAEREVRSIQYQMKLVRLPAHCELGGKVFCNFCKITFLRRLWGFSGGRRNPIYCIPASNRV
ncbi:ATP-binding protein [Candidatus Vondammii sp. HM_W22]|uniref:ATP-binding protein n=1 Tax=Candidatus Vondammii sp. HM_W22 TaxID=2687299 RepID=UPI001F139402|nr:ATP-binding protein [Candidatus Vondammii sp. HM_W22]